MKETIIYAISLLILITFSIALGYQASDEIESMISKFQNNYNETPEECINLSLEDTAYCLNNYVKSIHKYRKNKDSNVLTLEELKEQGGDCKDWTDLYCDYGEELGFNVKRPVIKIREDSWHTFAIISDETGYCLLDQVNIKCYEMGNDR